MALIQIEVDDDVCRRADEAFARSGITTPMAMKMMVTQVANEGRTPFDGLFTNGPAQELPDDVRRDIVYAEAVELGILQEHLLSADPTQISDSVLAILEIDPEEVDQ